MSGRTRRTLCRSIFRVSRFEDAVARAHRVPRRRTAGRRCRGWRPTRRGAVEQIPADASDRDLPGDDCPASCASAKRRTRSRPQSVRLRIMTADERDRDQRRERDRGERENLTGSTRGGARLVTRVACHQYACPIARCSTSRLKNPPRSRSRCPRDRVPARVVRSGTQTLAAGAVRAPS